MTPEEALAVLEKFNAPPSDEELEHAFIWWTVQKKIMAGGLTQAREVTDQRQHERSKELAVLHGQIMTAQRADPPRPCIEQKLRQEQLLEEIHKEAWAELRQNGLPEPWRRAHRKN
jgi:hypothetical protein